MDNKEKQSLINEFLKNLHELSEREFMNDSLYFFSRRQKAQLCRNIINDLYAS